MAYNHRMGSIYMYIPLIILAFWGGKSYILWCLLRLDQTRFGHVQELYRGAVLFSTSVRSPGGKTEIAGKTWEIRTIFLGQPGLLVFFFALKVFLEIHSKGGLLSKVYRTVFFSDHFWRMRNFMSKRSFNMSTRQSEEVDSFESYCLQIQKLYLDMWFAKIFLPNVVPNIASCEILKVSVLFDIENFES